jgi:hypothetical protein
MYAADEQAVPCEARFNAALLADTRVPLALPVLRD